MMTCFNLCLILQDITMIMPWGRVFEYFVLLLLCGYPFVFRDSPVVISCFSSDCYYLPFQRVVFVAS